VIAGEEDRVTPPRESEILAKGISDSTLASYCREKPSRKASIERDLRGRVGDVEAT